MMDKKKKYVEIMFKVLGIAPVIALVVFTILFTFVLKDMLEERILHSVTTFLLWMFASTFYIMIVAYFKNKKAMIKYVFGMIISVSLAVLMTPLDRYVRLCFARAHAGAYIAAVLLLVVYCLLNICWRRKFEG